MCTIEHEHLHLVCCILYMLPRKLTRADVSKFPQKMENAKCDFSKCEKARSIFRHFIWLFVSSSYPHQAKNVTICNATVLVHQQCLQQLVSSASIDFFYHRYIATLASCPINFLHPPSPAETVLLPLWWPLLRMATTISTTMAMEEVLY